MAIPVGAAARAEPLGRAAARAVPWTIFAVLFAATSVVVGVIWDISWHRTIGRDTFWTPAHLAIYLGGVVAGFSCGWLVLRTTFAGTVIEKAAGVRFWGFRGPLGAWVCIWGSIAMITSAPFDNWWHNAYGLDVQILSPPHGLLALGIITIQLGAMLMVLAHQNREPEGRARAFGWGYLYAAGILVLMAATMAMEHIAAPNHWHRGPFYMIAGGMFPLVLVAAARGAKLSWPATAAAGVYMSVTVAMIWILQLFPAQPRLAPIYNLVTHMAPPFFPILLVVPAAALDVIMRRMGRNRDWRLSVLLGAAFVAVLLVVQWFFAEFLLSPAARNFVFGADQWDYTSRLGPWRYEFWDLDRDPAGNWSPALLGRGVGFAMVIAIVSSRIGLWWGNWMARVRR